GYRRLQRGLRWEKPRLDWPKYNVDTGFHDRGKVASVDFCFRNSSGDFVTTATSWKGSRVSTIEGAGGSSFPQSYAVCACN
ncbi:hypothetical protein A2U01_0060278, partial [Trifolium medium]|nr:hypothetical protein [Trifolium medium]